MYPSILRSRTRIVVQYPRKLSAYRKVILLRKKGLGLREIARRVPVAKSTISLWCRDIKLSSKQKAILNKRWKTLWGQRLGAAANHSNREKEISTITSFAKSEIDTLSSESFKIAGAVLYWGEGSKKQNTSISNSDPRIIIFMVRWFEKVCGIPPSRLNAHLHIHELANDVKIKKYWSEVTGIPLKNFGKSFLKQKGTGYRKNVLVNGVIRIRVIGEGSGNLRHRILAWIEKVHELALPREVPYAKASHIVNLISDKPAPIA